MPLKIGVIGASGYTGGELLRILIGHPKADIRIATSRKLAGKPIPTLHPNLQGYTDLKFTDMSAAKVANEADFVFTATPHGASMKIVPELLDRDVRVVDLSGDYRFENVEIYERYYGLKHASPQYKAVYGLPELYRTEIRDANLVANPGCYPTGAILAAAPIVKEGLVERVIFDSKSGTSGAGSTPKQLTHHPECGENIIPYKVTTHRHKPEIEQELLKQGKVKVSFTPHLIPIVRGIITTAHILPKTDADIEEIHDHYQKFYADETFVRVLPIREIPDLGAVVGSNYCDIGCFEVDSAGRIVIISAIDNLVKGAAGQAVQNMNIMCKYNEWVGLTAPALHP